jgi:hypothetical protein
MPVRPMMDTTYSEVWDVMTNAPSTNMVKRDVDSAFIPSDEGNMDYLEFLRWCDAGNQPTPYAPPEPATGETNGDLPEPARKATIIKSGGGPAPSRKT